MPLDPFAWIRERKLIDEERIKGLENVRLQAKRMLEDQSLLHYTSHGLDHSDRVLDNVRRLSADNLGMADDTIRLNEIELVSLTAAVYLHDIGMQTLVFVQDEIGESGFSTDLAEKVREKHAECGARLIEKSVGIEKHKFPTLGLDQEPLIESLAEVIRDIVSNHSGPAPNLSAMKMLYNKQVRTGFLTALLRLADSLDLNEERVKLERLKRFRIPEHSQLHWWRHHYVRAVQIDKGLISIHMSFHPKLGIVFVDYFKELVLDEIRRELAKSNRVLFANGIRFLLDEEVKITQDESLSRHMPPSNLTDFIEKELRARGETFGTIKERSKGLLPVVGTRKDWISYWKFKGNPWVDLPLQFKDEEFVKTDNIQQILSELESIVQGKRGDLRILTGERGSGKTTFFNVFEDFFEGQDIRARYLDISEEIFDIHHPKEVYDWLFRRIFQIMSLDSTEQFSESKLRRELRTYSRGKLVLGVDNLDKFTRPEEQEIIKQFFAMSQGLLQDLKNKCVIIMACAPSWQNMLQSTDLHYLSTRTEWRLLPFKKSEVRLLLEKRLLPSGLKFEDVFEESVLTPIFSLSDGNPRRVVQLAEDLCVRAAGASAKKIDAGFVDSQLIQEILPRMRKEIDRIAGISNYYAEAVTRFFLFHERMERERLSEEPGWEMAIRVLEGQNILLGDVDERYLGAIAYISTRFSRALDEGKFEVSLISRPETKDFIKKWLETGFTLRDFISAFRLKPWSPARIEAEVAARIFDVNVTGATKEFLDSAKECFDKVLGEKMGPVPAIECSWEAIENLLKALYVHYGIMSSEGVKSLKPRDSLGRVRHDNVALVSEANELLYKLTRLAQVAGYIRYFDEIYFLARKREKVFKTPSRHLTEFTDRDAELSKLAMKKVFIELLPLFQTAKS